MPWLSMLNLNFSIFQIGACWKSYFKSLALYYIDHNQTIWMIEMSIL